MRKLATVETLNDLWSHPMADYLVWQQMERNHLLLIFSIYHSEITGDLLGIRRD